MAGQDEVVATLARQRPAALFYTELVARLDGVEQLERAVAALEERHAVLVLSHEAPDVHLDGLDLRVVALVSRNDGERSAVEAAEAVWAGWLRQFLATHRCE